MARANKNKESAIGSQNRTVTPNEAKSALIGNVHFPIELKLLQKKLLASTSNNDQLHQLKEQLSVLDQRRNIKITNYIPNLHKYV